MNRRRVLHPPPPPRGVLNPHRVTLRSVSPRPFIHPILGEMTWSEGSCLRKKYDEKPAFQTRDFMIYRSQFEASAPWVKDE